MENIKALLIEDNDLTRRAVRKLIRKYSKNTISDVYIANICNMGYKYNAWNNGQEPSIIFRDSVIRRLNYWLLFGSRDHSNGKYWNCVLEKYGRTDFNAKKVCIGSMTLDGISAEDAYFMHEGSECIKFCREVFSDYYIFINKMLPTHRRKYGFDISRAWGSHSCCIFSIYNDKEVELLINSILDVAVQYKYNENYRNGIIDGANDNQRGIKDKDYLSGLKTGSIIHEFYCIVKELKDEIKTKEIARAKREKARIRKYEEMEKAKRKRNNYVYIARNDIFPHLLKIGMTTVDPNERVKGLNSKTGVPGKYKLLFYTKTKDARKLEKTVHKALSKFRYSNNKEFFEVDLDTAVDIIKLINNRE